MSMSLADQINSHKFLYMTYIGEPEDNVLRLVIEEAKAAETPVTAEIGHIATIVHPIVVTENDLAYEIIFERYITYSVTNESFAQVDEYEQYEGRALRIYSKSHFLDYVQAATFASADYPGPYKHYSIICLNHIVDIASVGNPIIRIIRGADAEAEKSGWRH